jgi:thioredoxin 1
MEKKTRNIILIVVLVALVVAVTTIVLVKGNANKKDTLTADSLAMDTVVMDTAAAGTVIQKVSVDTSEASVKPANETTPDQIKQESQHVPVKQEPQASDPIAKALATGKPVVVDFGRGTCIPCKKMMPILAELKEEYSGKVEVLVLDLDEYFELAKEYGVQMIPTQIFFDPSGAEVSRHVGFMEKQAIIDQLAKMGTN